LDYIWFSARLGVRGVLQPCLLEPQLQASRLPTAVVPSDHLSLKAELCLN
jgi:mRNA deadenylase 3'-5' endonuclease subunit Ccr4